MKNLKKQYGTQLIKRCREKNYSPSIVSHITLALMDLREEDHIPYLKDLLKAIEKEPDEIAFKTQVWYLAGADIEP